MDSLVLYASQDADGYAKNTLEKKCPRRLTAVEPMESTPGLETRPYL